MTCSAAYRRLRIQPFQGCPKEQKEAEGSGTNEKAHESGALEDHRRAPHDL